MRFFVPMAVVGCTIASVFAQSMPQTVEDLVQEARTSIEEGDFEKASSLLDDAESLAPASTIPVTREGLRNIAFYRGVLDHYLGEGVVNGYPTDTTMDYFRQALVHDLSFEWDRGLVADPEGGVEQVFAQLRDEIGSRNQSDSRVPMDTPIRVFVDGSLVSADDFIIHGRHLVQVMCADSRVLGQWVEFGRSPDFGCMCDQASCFYGGKKEARTRSEDGSLNWSVVALGTGGALIAGGALTHLLAVNPTFSSIEEVRAYPHSTPRADADALTSKFNLQRGLALGLYAGGVVAAGAGGGLMVMDALSIHPLGNGLGLSGRF